MLPEQARLGHHLVEEFGSSGIAGYTRIEARDVDREFCGELVRIVAETAALKIVVVQMPETIAKFIDDLSNVRRRVRAGHRR